MAQRKKRKASDVLEDEARPFEGKKRGSIIVEVEKFFESSLVGKPMPKPKSMLKPFELGMSPRPILMVEERVANFDTLEVAGQKIDEVHYDRAEPPSGTNNQPPIVITEQVEKVCSGGVEPLNGTDDQPLASTIESIGEVHSSGEEPPSGTDNQPHSTTSGPRGTEANRIFPGNGKFSKAESFDGVIGGRRWVFWQILWNFIKG